jgi:hypothetical protein
MYSKLGPQSAADFLNAQAIKLTPEGRCAGDAGGWWCKVWLGKLTKKGCEMLVFVGGEGVRANCNCAARCTHASH